MAITQEITLAAQPAVGTTELIPLGGNGWISPQSAFLVDFRVTGDATGGRITLTVNRDERFEHIVSMLQLESDSATATEYIFNLHRGKVVTHNVGTQKAVNLSSLDFTSIAWNPTPMIAPTKWSAIFDNVDTIVSKWMILIYNFNIRASEMIPLSVLFQSLPRASAAL